MVTVGLEPQTGPGAKAESEDLLLPCGRLGAGFRVAVGDLSFRV